MLSSKSILASSASIRATTRIPIRSNRFRVTSLSTRFNSTTSTSKDATPTTPSTCKTSDSTFLSRRFPKVHSRYEQGRNSKAGKATAWFWTNKRKIALTAFSGFFFLSYATLKYDAMLRDLISDDTYLVWRIHDGSIVECRTAPSIQQFLSPTTSGEDPARVMELFEVLRTLKYAAEDERVKGIFGLFGDLHSPSNVPSNPLGLAQCEELVQAIMEFNVAKRAQLGQDARPSIAWADSFHSQSQFMLASAFEELYVQRSGSIPLTGLSASIPFFGGLAKWLGINVYAEARREFKSMISTFTQSESLPPAQLKNEAELLGELNRGLCHAIGVSRYPNLEPEAAADKVAELSTRGPIPASEAVKEGLITGVAFKREIFKSLKDNNKKEKELKEGSDEKGNANEKKEAESKVGEEKKPEELKEETPESSEKKESARDFKAFDHYFRINSSSLDRNLKDDEILEIGVVYLLGSIGSGPGEFSASSVVKGLKEASEDEDIQAIVLRIDSGGGDVVASESIWDAIRRVREETHKPVIASFGNIVASGGYYAAAACDDIVASENTITGSIGVASLRPTFTKKFFDRFYVGVQSFFTGSKASSSLHDFDDLQVARQREHIDEMYSEFLKKVCEGRGISPDVIEELAGGRVMTGLKAYVLTNKDQEVEVVNPSTDDETSEKPTPKKVKIGSLTSDWKTREVAGNEQMSTMMIEAEKSTLSSASVPATSSLVEAGEGILGEVAEAASSLAEAASGKDVQASSSSSLPESEENLAARAHEAAEASKSDASPPGAGSSAVVEEVKLGPYGRGLVGRIGGIMDATMIAMNLALNKEIAALIGQGMTLEQAMQSVRPKAQREINENGIALASDLRLKRFPEEKTFLKRVKQLNRRDEMPQMNSNPFSIALSMISNTISISIDEVSNRVANAVAASAARMMFNSLKNPESLRTSQIGKELGFDGRARAEYQDNIR